MTESDRPTETKQGFAAAFVSRMRGPHSESRLGPRVWAVAVAVVVVAAVAIGFGVLAKPHLAPKAAANTSHLKTSTSATVPQSTSNTPTPVIDANPFGGQQASGPVGGVSPGGDFSAGGAGVPAVDGQFTAGVPAGGVPAQVTPPATHIPKVAAKKTSVPTLVYSATTGYGCQENSNLQFTQNGFYADGKKGWTRHTAGGWGSDGCDGQFDSMPMSGSTATDDPTNFAVWQFRSSKLSNVTCKVSIWVPNDSSSQDVGGNPSTYLIFPSWSTSGNAPFDTQINQPANRNHWSTVTVPVSSGALSVKLLSRGIDYNSAGHADYAHHAVAQVHVDCYRG